MLQGHPEIDTAAPVIVAFNQFVPRSLDILIHALTPTTDWVPFQALKQELLLSFGRIIATYGAQVAFPTRTLHLANTDGA